MDGNIYLCSYATFFLKLEITLCESDLLIQSLQMIGKYWKIMEMNQPRNVGTLFEAFYMAVGLFFVYLLNFLKLLPHFVINIT